MVLKSVPIRPTCVPKNPTPFVSKRARSICDYPRDNAARVPGNNCEGRYACLGCRNVTTSRRKVHARGNCGSAERRRPCQPQSDRRRRPGPGGSSYRNRLPSCTRSSPRRGGVSPGGAGQFASVCNSLCHLGAMFDHRPHAPLHRSHCFRWNRTGRDWNHRSKSAASGPRDSSTYQGRS